MINSIGSNPSIYSTQNQPSNIPIDEKMTARETGLEQGAENTGNAIDLLGIADGAMEQVLNSLQGLRETLIQSNNGIMTETDKDFLQNQVQGYLDSIDDALKGTEYNTIKLFDNFEGNVQSGPNQGHNQTMRVQSTSLESLGIEGISVFDNNSLERVDHAIEIVSEARSDIGAQSNGMESNIRYTEIARENTLASQSNLQGDFAKQIIEYRQAQALREYQLAMQKNQMDSEMQNQKNLLDIVIG